MGADIKFWGGKKKGLRNEETYGTNIPHRAHGNQHEIDADNNHLISYIVSFDGPATSVILKISTCKASD